MDERKKLNNDSVRGLLGKENEGAFRIFLKDWKWILGYSRKYSWSIVLHCILGILGSTLSIASAVISKHLIDLVIGNRQDDLWFFVFLMIAATGFSLLTSSLSSRISSKVGLSIRNDLQTDIFQSLFESDWMSLNRFSQGDLLSRMNQDVTTVAGNAVSSIPSLIMGIYHFTATFCVILYYDSMMAFIALLSAPVLLLLGRSMMHKSQEYRRQVMEANSRQMSFESEVFYNTDLVKSFDAASFLRKKFEHYQSDFEQTSLQHNLFQIKTSVTTKITSAIVSLIAFGYCLLRLWSGTISFGTMTMFLQQRSALSSQFQSLFSLAPGMLNSAVSAQRIRELIELPKETLGPGSSVDGGISVSVRGVSFAYESRNIIADANLTANPGEIIALSGPSGEGKTTLIRMILGLIRPQTGKILLNGEDGNSAEMASDLRRYFAYVPQGNSVLAGTVADNLRLAKPDATEGEMLAALETACALGFVNNLSDGIHSPIGERGRGLSEGQAQRIAIARAILKDAPVLILDEATSALDPDTERRVLSNFIKKYPDKTCIFSTHRTAVFPLCNRVYRVMENTVAEV